MMFIVAVDKDDEHWERTLSETENPLRILKEIALGHTVFVDDPGWVLPLHSIKYLYKKEDEDDDFI